MSHFKAKMHQIRFRLGLCPRPRWGSLQRSSRPPSWILRGLLLRGGEGGEGKGGRERKGRGGEERGEEGEGGEAGEREERDWEGGEIGPSQIF